MIRDTLGHKHSRTRRLLSLLLRPRSINGLVLSSFLLVATPLIVAILAGVIYVNRLNEQSERLVMQGINVTRDSKQLDSLLTNMERSARQYRVLGDADLVHRFRAQAEEFDAVVTTLAGLHLNTMPSWDLSYLRRHVHKLAESLGQDSESTNHVIAALGAVHKTTQTIADQGREFVGQELAHLQHTARRARTFLLICAFALIPAVLILGIFLTLIITRPLRQILAAVSHLGTGDFSRPVAIVAPAAELDRLGERLDWMRQQLATINEEKQQFIQHMSHELKTPLASLREGTDLLSDATVGELNEAQAEVAEILRENTLDLAALIDNLLGAAARGSRQSGLEYSEFDLIPLIDRAAERQRLAIEKKNLCIFKSVSCVPMIADAERFHLIVDNLLANAVKYSPKDGIIRFEIDQNEEGIYIHVSDDGPGVDRSERELIFETFKRGNAAPATESALEGTGIGLSVVRECARAHNGEARVVERGDRQTVFQICIPTPHA